MKVSVVWLILSGFITLCFCEDASNTTLAIVVPTVSIPAVVITTPSPAIVDNIPCTCGVFLSGQFVKGSADPPRGNAALLHELMVPLPCTPMGLKQCTNKCLDAMVKHLPNSPAILCGSIDRDCHKERAYLFVKNCNDKWVNTNLSAGREYCCKDGLPYKCPILS